MTHPPWLAGAPTKEQNRAAGQYFTDVKEAERLMRLSDGTATAFGDILRRAGKIARAKGAPRPCSYSPWLAAFQEVNLRPGVVMDLVRDAARPPWPTDASGAIDFTLTVLEEDPMFFRSGYTKRHLVDRLRQQRFSEEQSRRVDALLRKIVVNGTGLEEFRAFCRLAAKLRPEGFLDWLDETANGVYLRPYEGDIAEWWKLSARLGEEKLLKLTTRNWFRKPKWAFVGTDPELPLVEMKPEDWHDPIVQTRRNAWRMGQYVKRAEVMDKATVFRQARRARQQAKP